MRSGFGRAAQRIRNTKGMSQTEFAEKSGWSLSRISNIEYQRAVVSDDVLRVYLRVLTPTGEEATELRKLASYSNSVRKGEKDAVPHPPLVALFEQFGNKLSPGAVATIQRIIEKETGEQVSTLRFSNSQKDAHKTRTKKKRPSLNIQRFVEICIIAGRFRRRFAAETSKLPIDLLLEGLAVKDCRFDYRIVEFLPSSVDGAFACIIGEADGNVLVLEEERFRLAEKGVYFARHVIAHEIGHHVLHELELKSNGELIFAPQPLARNSGKTIGSDSPVQQVVDTRIEVEAECFATFLLVPWEAFVKGTELKYLAQDFGEQPEELRRYYSYFKQDAVVEEFKQQLWQLGENSHPIFAA